MRVLGLSCSSELMSCSSSVTSSSAARRVLVLIYSRYAAICTNSLATSRSMRCISSRYARYWSRMSEMLMSLISILFFESSISMRLSGPSKS